MDPPASAISQVLGLVCATMVNLLEMKMFGRDACVFQSDYQANERRVPKKWNFLQESRMGREG